MRLQPAWARHRVLSDGGLEFSHHEGTGNMTKRSLLLAGIAAFAVLPAPAFAEDDADAPADNAADQPVSPVTAAEINAPENVIIITARRRDEAAQDVPLAIGVLDGRTINDTGSFNVQKLQQ